MSSCWCSILQSILFSQVSKLMERGMMFLDIPDTYYTNLRERLKKSKCKVKEDLAVVSTNCL